MLDNNRKTLYLYTGVSKLIGIENKRLLYWANKINAKPYKVAGRRFIDSKDLICVLQILRRRVTNEQRNAIDKFLQVLL